jgi:hypothetical protein
MPDLPTVPRLEDPFAHLRRAVDSHAAAVAGSVAAGEQVQADKQPPPPPAPEPGQ